MLEINIMKANEIQKKEPSFWIDDIEVVVVIVVVVVVCGVVGLVFGVVGIVVVVVVGVVAGVVGVVGVIVDVDVGIDVVDVVGGSSLSQTHSQKEDTLV